MLGEVPARMRRYVDEMLRGSASYHRMHMPGHKGISPFPETDLYALDTTELDQTDDLFRPRGAIAKSEARYATCVGAGASVYLTNGATAGIHAMLALWAREGDKVLLPRCCHLSAVNACILQGLEPVWIPAKITADGYAYVPEKHVLEAISLHPDVKAVLLTHPDYQGGMFSLRRIAEKAHALGIKLIVDEAHGAHFPWLDTKLSAGEQGADAWVQSCHKTLPALTGAAVLHLHNQHDADRARALVARISSTSPSYLLVRSIDEAFVWMETYGSERLQDIRTALCTLRDHLPSMGYRDGSSVLQSQIGAGYQFDPTRLLIDAPQGGEALAQSLFELGWNVEACDPWRVTCIVTAMDTSESIALLGAALKQIQPSPRRLTPQDVCMTALPEQIMTPRKAVMADTCLLPLSQSVNRVSAVSAGIYPPGVPLIVPGEVITAEIAEQLAKTPDAHRFGLEKGDIRCVV